MEKPRTENKNTNKIILRVYDKEISRTREVEPWPTKIWSENCISNLTQLLELSLHQTERYFLREDF
jgi:hypothetical protein